MAFPGGDQSRGRHAIAVVRFIEPIVDDSSAGKVEGSEPRNVPKAAWNISAIRDHVLRLDHPPQRRGRHDFLDLLPANTRAAFEFRHESWFDDETLTLLGAKDCALVASDTDDKPLNEIMRTATWGYLRLRRTAYNQNDLFDWMKRVQDQKWKEGFVFFKHEDEGTGPELAAQFLKLADRD